jgi:hypothetical protein
MYTALIVCWSVGVCGCVWLDVWGWYYVYGGGLVGW